MILSCIIVACTTFLSEKTAATISGILVTPHLILSSWNKLVSYKLLVIVYLPKFVSNLKCWILMVVCKVIQMLINIWTHKTIGFLCRMIVVPDMQENLLLIVLDRNRPPAQTALCPRCSTGVSEFTLNFLSRLGVFGVGFYSRVLTDSWVKIGWVEPACLFSIYILNNPRFGKLSYKKR